MSDEKNVELGVFEALNALAEEKNASAAVSYTHLTLPTTPYV